MLRHSGVAQAVKRKETEKEITMKPNPKIVGKKSTAKKAELNAPIKKSSVATARLAVNHNETLVRI